MKKHYGITLITVLIFLQIFSLFALYELTASRLALKMSHHWYQQQLLLIQSEKILATLEKTIINNPEVCQIPVTNVRELIAKPLSWWQREPVCSGNFQMIQYYYVIEALGMDPCAAISPEKKGADYFRITLFVTLKNNPAKKIMQSTLVTHHAISQSCEGIKHSVKVGRQMWYEII